MSSNFIAWACLHFITYSFGASPQQWKSKSIYQLLTDRFAKTVDDYSDCTDLGAYCGGTFKGITNHYNQYITNGLGFDAIWISPVVTQVPWNQGGLSSFHGYWAYDIYTVNSHFGTDTDLILLSNMTYLMIDVVANHMGPPQNNDYNNFKGYNPFNETIHYHDCNGCPDDQCNIENYDCFQNINEIRHCRLMGLPDLNQNNSFVSNALISWIKEYVVGKWKADGIRYTILHIYRSVFAIDILSALYTYIHCRIDTVEYVNQDFWTLFQQSAGVYAVGEVESTAECCTEYQLPPKGIDAILNYPLYWSIRNVFGAQQSISVLYKQIMNNKQTFKDTTILGNFVDNHDQNRFLCDYPINNNLGYHRKYINALTFVLTFEGIPIIYYGTEQGFNGCASNGNNRECLWPSKYILNSTDISIAIVILNDARKQMQIWNQNFTVIQADNSDRFFAYSRGDSFLVLLTNTGYQPNITYKYTLTNPNIKTGVTYCNVFWPVADCFNYTGGNLEVYLVEGESKVYIPSIDISHITHQHYKKQTFSYY